MDVTVAKIRKTNRCEIWIELEVYRGEQLIDMSWFSLKWTIGRPELVGT